jgi:hypothetical protein
MFTLTFIFLLAEAVASFPNKSKEVLIYSIENRSVLL